MTSDCGRTILICRGLTFVLLLFCVTDVEPLWAGQDFGGLVVSVLDGDTIEVLHDQRPERIRLYGIDCRANQPKADRAMYRHIRHLHRVCLYPQSSV